MTAVNNQTITTLVTLRTLQKYKSQHDRFACLTAYDASYARLLAAAGVEVLLVGDSLGMVIQGQTSTLPVTIADMIYHTRCVRRGSPDTLLIADMPFMSDMTPMQALGNASRLLAEGGANVVKLEGGARLLDTVSLLAGRGVPVCAHLGLLPQSVNKLGGYSVQGRDARAARQIVQDAQDLERAGADLVLIECVPNALAEEVVARLKIPVIGIGAGPSCDGQVLVVYDMLGITPGKPPRFVRNFLADHGDVQQAVAGYVEAVRNGTFPAPEHCFK
ncbi:MAG: 3-methyl-2-oxobutanoate hydroxymethyltransferase [Gammaproteobacteria bacterium]|nr:MAG: 3-methyl-2-oxobutanoate hydroxymethyltransferase [Gammaproteobacteria bacterium]TND06648.1 MAG: 3-methyl-2-oxobutanoate hydroxymethyltransferase [Gammaproteobacteria bacterium]